MFGFHTKKRLSDTVCPELSDIVTAAIYQKNSFNCCSNTQLSKGTRNVVVSVFLILKAFLIFSNISALLLWTI